MEPTLLASNNNNGNCNTTTSSEHFDDDDDIIRWFEDVSSNAGSVQTQVLCRILKQNIGVEYLKKWLGNNLDDILEMDACALESLYTSMVPLASHEDFEPFIQKIADGDTSPILTQHPITTLSLSSGTTEGRQKFVPFNQHSAQTTLQTFTLSAAHISRVYPIREGGRILELIYSSKQSKTKGGLKVGTATTHYFGSREFKMKQEKTKSFSCSPYQVVCGGDHKQSTYCHLLLGLFFSDQIDFITSTFVYAIVQAFLTLQDHWPDMCNDIRHGTLSPRVKDPSMRQAVLDIITPSPSLASQIEATCKDLVLVDWFGLVPRLWPNAKYVYSIMTGSMLPYLKKLRHYAKGLALVSGDYGSTESWIGVNVDPSLPPEAATFAVVPTFSYFEFIPLYRSHSSTKHHSTSDDFLEDNPIPLSQVQLGQHYELVLTTFTGLYRYRLGDVVEVAGFHNGTPKLKFIFRRKLILTVNIDKNTERDLQTVVEKGSEVLQNKGNAELVDFTSCAEMPSSKQGNAGCYVIFWEIRGEAEDKVLEECCTEMDAAFVDYGYVVSRKACSIGPLMLCIVEPGTFDKILDYFVANGAALGQFKTPRCITNPILLNILHASTIKTFSSTAYN